MDAHIEVWTWSILGVVLVIATITDAWRRVIPDWLTLPALVVLLGLRWWHGGLGDLQTGLISGLVSAAAVGGFFALWTIGDRMGWGDVKLMAVVGAAFGFPVIQVAALLIALVGALQAVVTLLWEGALWATLERALSGVASKLGLAKAGRDASARRSVPYGIAIALGSFWTMWWERAALVAP